MQRFPWGSTGTVGMLHDCMSAMPGPFEPALCQALASQVSAVVDMRRGETLAHTGSTMDFLYVVASGVCKSVMLGEDGAQQVVYFYWPREILELNALAAQRYVTDVIAVTSARLYEIPITRVQSIGQAEPEVLEFLLAHVSERLAEAERSQYMLGSLHSAQRIAFLLLDVLHRLPTHAGGPPEVALPMSRGDLASYLGLAPETISRLLTWFQEQRIIRIGPGRLVQVLEQQRLRELLQGDPRPSPLSRLSRQ